jgi:ketose-bisphosphate aldolase
MLRRALDGGYAVGYFEAWDSYSLEAVAEAAEAEAAPVILGFGCMMVAPGWLDGAGIAVLGATGRAVAERTRVPVALLLNEAHTHDQAVRGIEAGFTAVMLNTSDWPAAAARDGVARLVEHAHAHGVAVEAELGRLPDADPGRGPGGIDTRRASLTDPDDAAAFIAATGADCLAVSVGNVHLLLEGAASIDLDRLAAIGRRVAVPLVMHGGSGFPGEAIGPAIARGVAKFNVGTVLKRTYLDGLRGAVAGWDGDLDVHAVTGSHRETDVLEAGKAGLRERVRALIRLYGGSGRAGEG